MKKLSEFIKQLQDIQSKLNGDPSIHIAHMPDIKVKMLKDWTLGLRGCEEIEVTPRTEILNKVMYSAEFIDSQYSIRVDSHAGGFLNKYKFPSDGRYKILLDTCSYNHNPYPILCETTLLLNKVILNKFNRKHNVEPKSFITDNSVSDEPFFIGKGEKLEIRVVGNVNWSIYIEKV